MKTYTPKKPSGVSSKWRFRRWVWDLLAGGLFPIAGDGDVVVQWVSGIYRISVKSRSGGSGVTGWFWSDPIEIPVAPYPAYKKGAVMHIQSGHAIVTTGIVDAAAPSGPLVKSQAGRWIAMRAVPAQATVGAVAVWNLPQNPMPVPTNYDDPANFWSFLPDASDCI